MTEIERQLKIDINEAIQGIDHTRMCMGREERLFGEIAGHVEYSCEGICREVDVSIKMPGHRAMRFTVDISGRLRNRRPAIYNWCGSILSVKSVSFVKGSAGNASVTINCDPIAICTMGYSINSQATWPQLTKIA